MQALHHSSVLKLEPSKKAKLSAFESVFFPIYTFGRDFLLVTKRVLPFIHFFIHDHHIYYNTFTREIDNSSEV